MTSTFNLTSICRIFRIQHVQRLYPRLAPCISQQQKAGMGDVQSPSRPKVFGCASKDLFKGFRQFSTSTDVNLMSSKKIYSVSPANSGKHLVVKWDNGEESKLISQWLRFNCQCPECVSPSSNQRMVYADKLVFWPRISSSTIRGES